MAVAASRKQASDGAPKTQSYGARDVSPNPGGTRGGFPVPFIQRKPSCACGGGCPRCKEHPAQNKLRISQPGDRNEREADRLAEQVVLRKADPNSTLMTPGPTRFPATPANGPLPRLPLDEGIPLSATTRRFAEPAFGQDFGHVRLHTSPVARMTAAKLGARAFTSGSDIWLGPGESDSDRSLMAHELAHVVQQNGDQIYLRRATWLERRAWLGFFSHYLPRKLINNYMDDTGAPITLTQREMVDSNPIVDLRRSPAFLAEVGRLRAAGGGTSTINVSGWGGALTNGTLGNFTINHSGQLTVTAAGDWTFSGVMDFYDFWDFDPKPFGSRSGRPVAAEIKVRVAAYGIPGRPFHVRSIQVPVTQTSADSRATWAGGSPTAVPEPSRGAATDIAVGAESGAGGGGEVGAGAGAQAAEDLNH